MGMIRSKQDYLAYLEADRINLKCGKDLPTYLFHDIWRFQRLLRRFEYQKNCKKGRLAKLVELYLQLRLKRLGTHLGFSIAPNTFGPGLTLVHRGTVVVNHQARIGANCRVHVDVVIGAARGEPGAPQIGDNVYLAPGAKLFGAITIADDIAVGANAAVGRSFEEPGITIGGVPAEKISNKGSSAAGPRSKPSATRRPPEKPQDKARPGHVVR